MLYIIMNVVHSTQYPHADFFPTPKQQHYTPPTKK